MSTAPNTLLVCTVRRDFFRPHSSMFRLTVAPLTSALKRSILPTSRIALKRQFVATPLLRGSFKEQPILTDPSTPPKNPSEPPQEHGNDRKDKSKEVFKPEELETARLARLASLGWLAKLPEKWIPYAELMRLEKPVGTLLLLAPCFWAITMGAYSIAAPLTTTISVIALFSIGALVMRGAGCTINDIWDRDLDNQVARTVERPIASGRVSVPQAVAWLGVQCFAGLAVLLSLPFECFYLGALSLPFVAAYPLFKRYTYYPQAMLSITFAWGCLLGFPAVGAPLNPLVVAPLFASKWLWCMIYDTVYAHQDKVYDIKAGIKSSALAWGDKSKPIMYSMGVLQAATFLTAGFMNSMGPFFYLSAAWGFQRLFRQLKNVNLDDPKSCWAMFTGNIRTGYIFWFGMVIDYLLLLLGVL